MSDRVLPRYPIYIPSKDRFDVTTQFVTAQFLIKDEVPFKLVVEEHQAEAYGARFGDENVLVLPHRDQGLFQSRNWIKEHATAEGHERHWQLDDNIMDIRYRWKNNRRITCAAGPALAAVEDFTDRYENIAISGLNYKFFVTPGAPPYFVNVHVYSCTLVNNAIPHRWRLLYNDDTDICLQVLTDGWCTVLVNVFSIEKSTTMKTKGGNTDELYKIEDGRLKMARSLERMWPGVVTTDRRFGRPQHVVRDNWKGFDTPLKLKPDVDLAELAKRPNEYGLKLKRLREEKT